MAAVADTAGRSTAPDPDATPSPPASPAKRSASLAFQSEVARLSGRRALEWVIDRTASIGAVFTRVKKKTIRFPQLSDSGTFLDEFSCEVAEYDDLTRTVLYTHPETMQDDALHATNYALTLATYLHSRR